MHLCFIYRSILVLTSQYDDFYDSPSYLFLYDPYMDYWTSTTFPKDIEFYQKPNWVLVPILGVIYLFTSNNIWKYDEETVMWTKIDHSINFNLKDIAFLRIAFE